MAKNGLAGKKSARKSTPSFFALNTERARRTPTRRNSKPVASLPEKLIDLNYPLLRAVLPVLLVDKKTGRNIVWATDSYVEHGDEYAPEAEITIDALIKLGDEFRPRVLKQDSERRKRSKDHAEVFTPAWVCAYMNDFCDRDWYGRSKPIFTEPIRRGSQILNDWKPCKGYRIIPQNKSWTDYVESTRLEITCGEAPFIVTRYDAANSDNGIKKPFIPIGRRVGALDRKLWVILDKVKKNEKSWFKKVQTAYRSVFGYEYQGDNLLIARINLFMTFVEYYKRHFGNHVDPNPKSLNVIANIIVENFVQFKFEYNLMKKTNTLDELVTDVSSLIPEYEDCSTNLERLCCPYFINLKNGDARLKFDYVIGNPPYQEEVEGNARKRPVYNYIMDAYYEVCNKVLLITPGRFLYNAGFTPEEWNLKMLSDQHLKVLYYEPDSSVVFQDVDVKGGIVITYHNAQEDYEAIEVFFSFDELKGLYVKAFKSTKPESLSYSVYPYNQWNLEALYVDHPDFRKLINSDGNDRKLGTSVFTQIPIFRTTGGGNDFKVLGLIKNKRVYRYVAKKYIDQNHPNLFKYKVLVPKANGTGALGEVLSTPLIGEPLIGYTQSFIGIGAFDTQFEAEAAYKYVKSKFARALLGILKVTQDNPKGVWKYVPLQDFTADSDIDWTQSVAEIDRQLYAKYGLTESEINFIETKVRAME